MSLLFVKGQSKSEDCWKRINKPQYNLNICLKGKWYTNSTDPSKLVIGDHETQVKIGVSKRQKNNKKSSKEIWNIEYGPILKNDTYSFVSDTTLTKDSYEIYLCIYSYYDPQSKKNFRLGSAILSNKKKYQMFDTMYPKNIKDAETFFIDVLSNLKVVE